MSVDYSGYLKLSQILNAQSLESEKAGRPAHDEMLFIIIHQAYELWFKQLLFETDGAIAVLQKPALNDNTEDLQTIVHRLKRVITILQVLVHQIDIMETSAKGAVFAPGGSDLREDARRLLQAVAPRLIGAP